MANKVLITGGNGGISQGIANILKNMNYNVLTPNKEQLDVSDIFNICKYMIKFQPDILINCAGYIVPNAIKTISAGEWGNHININLSGTLYCSQYAILNGCKTIINIGSTAGFEARPEWGAYCISKAGVLALTECLAVEGFYAYSINPARTKSKMRERLFPNEDQSTLMNPERIGEFVLKILNGEFKSGSHLVVKKDEYYVIPPRKGV